jgi:hypothetical protein
MASKQYIFGSGTLFGTRTDLAAQTPIQFGALQNISLDFSYETKELYGAYQFPLAVARGKGKITGKASTGQVDANAFNSLFFGQTMTIGQTVIALNESGTIPGTPYQVTVVNSTTFVDDLGVSNVLTGVPLKKVAASPATGQYSVAAGVYTFATADTSNTVYISYSYTVASTGDTIAIANQLMGATPTFAVSFQETFNGNIYEVKLNQCVSSKLNFSFKNDDFNMSEFDFSAFADVSGNIGSISMTAL